VREHSIDDPDESLVLRIGQGDELAARQLMQCHLPNIVAIGYRLLGTRQDAEDLAQEVFLKVWLNAAKWQPGRAKFSTWIHRVAVNLCLDRLRKKRELLVETVPEQIDQTPPVVDKMVGQQTADHVQRAVSELPERQRAAITLCHFQDLGNIEAADIMGVSVEALESLLSRGRRRLRQLLIEDRDELLRM